MRNEEPLPRIVADDFKIAEIGGAVWLLTYRSSHVSDTGEVGRAALRSSIWLQTEAGFQLRFHQGTAIGNPSI